MSSGYKCCEQGAQGVEVKWMFYRGQLGEGLPSKPPVS